MDINAQITLAIRTQYGTRLVDGKQIVQKHHMLVARVELTPEVKLADEVLCVVTQDSVLRIDNGA
jgi:hypothetical protein